MSYFPAILMVPQSIFIFILFLFNIFIFTIFLIIFLKFTVTKLKQMGLGGSENISFYFKKSFTMENVKHTKKLRGE